MNNSTANLAATPLAGADAPPVQAMGEDTSEWGARLRPCLATLDRIHQQKIAAGQAPAWPFADYLEFEFVKWMVQNDISQTARDKLIKLPIVSTYNKLTLSRTYGRIQIAERCRLSFSSNYSLNKLLDKLPTAGPRWKRIVKTIEGTIAGPKPGQVLKEEVEIWVRDIIEVVRELIGNTAYGEKLVFVPVKPPDPGDPTPRKIDEMWTADWWLRIQVGYACMASWVWQADTEIRVIFPKAQLLCPLSYRQMPRN